MVLDRKLDERELLDGWLEVLFRQGYAAVPQQYQRAVVAEVMRRLADPVLGFWFFWIHFAYIQIKGRRRGDLEAERGWVRACPDGKPRVDERTGKTWAWQLEMCKAIVAHTILLILKARQIGFTFIVANAVVWAAISEKEQAIAVVAMKLQRSKALVRRSREVYNRLPDWLQAEVRLISPAITRLEFSNGSTVEPYAGKPDSARGDATSWLFCDEIGEFDELDEWWAANESVAETIVMFGTAKNNGLEDWCRDGASGDVCQDLVAEGVSGDVMHLPVYDGINGMSFLFVPWMVHPERNDAWIEKKLRTYKGNLANFNREYPTTWEDAFQATGLGYFNAPALQRQEVRLQAMQPNGMSLADTRDRHGTFVADPYDPEKVTFVEDPQGHVTIHASDEELTALLLTHKVARRPIAIPADCAGDKPEGDYHAASIILVGRYPLSDDDKIEPADVVPSIQIATIHGYMDSDFYATLLIRAGWYFGRALIAPETNGVGVPVIKMLRRMRYPNIYMRRTEAPKRQQKIQREYGWYSTSASKSVAYGEAERLLRNDWIELRDLETVREMKNVISLGNGGIGARKGKHDDRSDAVAIGAAISEYARFFDAASRAGAEVAPAWGTAAWAFDNLAKREAARGNGVGIGSENSSIMTG